MGSVGIWDLRAVRYYVIQTIPSLYRGGTEVCLTKLVGVARAST